MIKDLDTKDGLCGVVGICATKYLYLAQSSVLMLHLIYKNDLQGKRRNMEMVAWQLPLLEI